MEYEVVTLKQKRIVGFCQRTGNEKQNMSEVIGSLWQKLGECLEYQKNKKYIGLYSDYVDMDYDVTVGYEADENTVMQQGMTEKILPASKYAKFILHGDVVKTVQQAWQEIWNMNLERTFTGDFEEYQQGEDKQNMEIHIYVAIK